MFRYEAGTQEMVGELPGLRHARGDYPVPGVGSMDWVRRENGEIRAWLYGVDEETLCQIHLPVPGRCPVDFIYLAGAVLDPGPDAPTRRAYGHLLAAMLNAAAEEEAS